MHGNVTAWKYWTTLNDLDRPIGFGIAGIPTMAISNFCKDYNADFETYEKIILIEKLTLEKWRGDAKIKQEQDELKRKSKNAGNKN